MEKTRGWIKAVFDFALSDKLISENPIPLKDERLIKHVGEKYPSLQSPQDAGKLLRNLVDYGGSFEVATCVCLQLILHNGQASKDALNGQILISTKPYGHCRLHNLKAVST